MLNSIPWNFSPRTVTLLAGKREIFLDDYPWPFPFSREDAGGFFLPGPESLASVFSPLLILSHGTLTGPRGSAPAGEDGFSSPEELACVVRATMGLEMMRLGDRLVFSREGLSGDLPGSGDSRIRKGLFWFDEGQRLVPYQLIVPRGASPDALVVLLHGGGGNPDSCPKDFRGTLPDYAERFSCVLLCPDAVVKNSTYGCPVPPQGIDPQARGMFPNTPQDLFGRALAEKALLELLLRVREEFGIPRDRVFLAGNSMGGMGCFHFAARHRDIIRAIAPAGAAPEIASFDYEALAELPIFFTAGTRDHHGFRHLKDAADHMKRLGLSVTFRPVEGGTHQYAWVEDAPEWFAFLTKREADA